MKDNQMEAEAVVSDGIQHNGGMFGGFKVDPDSVNAKGTRNFPSLYHGINIA